MNRRNKSTFAPQIALGWWICLAPLISSLTQDETGMLQASLTPPEAPQEAPPAPRSGPKLDTTRTGLYSDEMRHCLDPESGWVLKHGPGSATEETVTGEANPGENPTVTVQNSPGSANFHITSARNDVDTKNRVLKQKCADHAEKKEQDTNYKDDELDRLCKHVMDNAAMKLALLLQRKLRRRNCETKLQGQSEKAIKILCDFEKDEVFKEHALAIRKEAEKEKEKEAEKTEEQKEAASKKQKDDEAWLTACHADPTKNCGCHPDQIKGMASFTRFGDPGFNVESRKSEFQIVMEHVGKPECIEPPAKDAKIKSEWDEQGWNQVTFDNNFEYYLKPKAKLLTPAEWQNKKRALQSSQLAQQSAYIWEFESHWSRQQQFEYKKGGYAIDTNLRLFRQSNWKLQPVRQTNAEWMTTNYVVKTADPEVEMYLDGTKRRTDKVGTRGNFFGHFGRLLVDTKFKAPLITAEELYNGLNAQFNIVPFYVSSTDELFLKFPGGGLFSNFQFINQWSGSLNDETEQTFEYVRNFVFNQQSQGSAFVEFHDFPHVFIPQSNRGEGRVLLAAVAPDNGRFTKAQIFPTLVTDDKAFKAGFDFMEVLIPWKQGLVCGGDCLHSDSATQGAILATVNPLDKTADTALLRFRDNKANLGTPFNPYQGIPDTPWVKYECYPASPDEAKQETEELTILGLEQSEIWKKRLIFSQKRFAENAPVMIGD